jgi:hypothetical protein
MDSRWQPNLGPVQPATTSPEACDLQAAGWRAKADECWICTPQGEQRLVSPETWRALRDRCGFVPVRLRMQSG